MATPQIFYSFKETSLGIYEFENLSGNLELQYTLSVNDSCSMGENLIHSKTLGIKRGVSISTNSIPNKIIFDNLPDGVYTLRFKHAGGSYYPTIVFYNFSNLEESILDDIKDLFSRCNSCKENLDKSCLLNKMNLYFFLSQTPITPKIIGSYGCTMLEKAACIVYNEKYGKENNCCDLEYMISFLYLLMYNRRAFTNKDEVYNYEEIKRYISSKIVNINL